MKRLFVCELDTLLGRQICERFGKLGEWEIVGTVRDASSLDAGLPPFVKSICARYREDGAEFKQQVLDSDTVICPLRDDVAEAGAAVRMLSTTAYDTEKTLVLVSSVQTWANTRNAELAEAAAEAAAERQARRDAGEEDVDDEGDAAAGEEEEAAEAPTYGDDAYQRRVPHQRYQHWRDLEVLAKQVNSETLHTYVVFAGLPYGAGEDLLHPLFRDAWHHHPLPLYTSGANVVPMIHVADLAAIVTKLGAADDVLPARYILAVDRGNVTLSQLVGAINTQLGTGETYAVPPSQHGTVRAVEHFTIDLRLEPSNALDVHDEADWVALDGFVAAAEKVCVDFRVARGVTPVRCIVAGPPGVGKTTLAGGLAEHYKINHVTLPDVIAEYAQHVDELEAKLRKIRVARREQRRIATREAKRREAAEAAAEAAAAAAEAAADAAAAEVGGEEDDEEADGEEGAGAAVSKAAPAVLAANAAAADGEQRSEGAESEFDVDFEVEEPPRADSAAAGDEEGDVEMEAADNGGGRAGRPRGADGGDEGDDERDDEGDDEEIVQLQDAIALARRVLSLRVQVSGPRQPKRPAATDDDDAADDGDAGGAAADGDEDGATGAAAADPTQPVKFRFLDEALAVMVRWRLGAKPCRNQGFVLDGFPKTTRQATLTFVVGDVPLPDDDALEELQVTADARGALVQTSEGDGESDPAALLAAVEDALLPEFCFVLNADEAALKARCLAANDGDDDTHGLARFYRRLRSFKEANDPSGKPHRSLVAWFRAILTNREGAAREMSVVPLDASASPGGPAEVLAAAVRVVGEPHYYKPTPAMLLERAREEAIAAETAALQAIRAQEAQELQAAAAAEEERRAAANHARRYTSIQAEQQLAEQMRVLPMQEYLMRYVIPAVTRSMKHVVAMRPEDPVDALADALFHYHSKTQL